MSNFNQSSLVDFSTFIKQSSGHYKQVNIILISLSITDRQIWELEQTLELETTSYWKVKIHNYDRTSEKIKYKIDFYENFSKGILTWFSSVFYVRKLF